MGVILAALAELEPSDEGPAVADPVLRRQLVGWGESRGEATPHPGVLLRGLAAWTRMHGILSLEIEGFFAQMDVDPARLYKVEIDGLLTESAASR